MVELKGFDMNKVVILKREKVGERNIVKLKI